MRQLGRLSFIVFTLLRYGVDDIALSGLRHPLIRALAPVARLGRRFDEPRGVCARRWRGSGRSS
jgi:ubiquinone biosynthesis protein